MSSGPIELRPNLIPRFYEGGPRISAFRGLAAHDDDAPEDWVASTTTVHGEDERGLSTLADGTRLADLFAQDPEAFFEPAHRARFGSDPTVLIKLLDAGERLPVHLHPDDRFAAAHLASRYGKTEAWFILDAEDGACVHLGFSRDVAPEELDALVAEQDADTLLSMLNRVPVTAGDAVFVPAGVPHAIGPGILLLELQQPSDLSLLLEWGNLMPEAEASLGLPRALALSAVQRSRLSVEPLLQARGSTLFPAEADRYFRAELVEGGAALEPSFSVLVGYGGEGLLQSESSPPVSVRRGSTVLVPFGAGPTRLDGSWRAVRCMPPLPAG